MPTDLTGPEQDALRQVLIFSYPDSMWINIRGAVNRILHDRKAAEAQDPGPRRREDPAAGVVDGRCHSHDGTLRCLRDTLHVGDHDYGINPWEWAERRAKEADLRARIEALAADRDQWIKGTLNGQTIPIPYVAVADLVDIIASLASDGALDLGYAQGYRDGESNHAADWQCALDDVLPSGVPITPSAVAHLLEHSTVDAAMRAAISAPEDD